MLSPYIIRYNCNNVVYILVTQNSDMSKNGINIQPNFGASHLPSSKHELTNSELEVLD